MSILIVHYRAKCIGCHACVTLAPDRWRMSRKDGKSVLLEGCEKKGIYTTAITIDEEAANRKAAKVCPARVIQVRRNIGNIPKS